MAYAEFYEVDCLGLEGGRIRTYEFTSTPLPGQMTDQQALIKEAKGNLSIEGLAKPPYAGITFKVRLVRRGVV